MGPTVQAIRFKWSWRGFVTTVAAAGTASALAVFATHDPKLATAAALAVLIVSVAAANPVLIIGAAIPATLVVERVGGGTSNISVSDLILAAATLVALPAVRLRDSPTLTRLLITDLVYELTLLPSVLYNPYRADFVEWTHELMLVSGSLIVGWVVGREGFARRALSVYLFGACIIAVFTCGQAVKKHFQPAYLPFGMQKNYIGIMMMFAIIIAMANPYWASWSLAARRFVLTVCVLALLGCQSHQAMIGTFAGAVFIYLRSRHLGRRSRIMLVALVPLLIIAYEYVTREFASSNRFNSVHQRLTWYSDSLQVFHVSPWFGVGLRWWYTGRFPFAFQPPNGELEMLTSAGIIGLAAFVFLYARTIALVWHIPESYGTTALALLLARLLDGQFDIFWVGATTALPFLVTGLALGVWTRSERFDAAVPSQGSHRNVAPARALRT